MLLGIMDDVQNGLLKQLWAFSLSSESAQNRLKNFLFKHINFLIEHRGITILLFSEAAHLNDSGLKKRLRSILLTQKHYISKIIQDGIVEGLWDAELQVENVALLYMGIPITLNIELVLDPQSVQAEDFCKRMLYFFNRILKKS